MSATEAGVRGRRKMPVAGSGETQGTRSDIHFLFGGTGRVTNTVLAALEQLLPYHCNAGRRRTGATRAQVKFPRQRPGDAPIFDDGGVALVIFKYPRE